MNRKYASVAAGILVMLPTQLFAGGPPRLCLPIEGVTPANQQACRELLASKLHDKLWRYEDPSNRAVLRADGNQWYAILMLGDEVGLRDVEAALRGSEFSIIRDRMRLFGHVVLEINPSGKNAADLIADLDATDFVSVANVDEQAETLRITVDMPYPLPEPGISDRDDVRWKRFQRNGLASDSATRSEGAIAPQALPGLKAIGAILAKHGAELNDIRWSTSFRCRQIGCVAVPDEASVAAAVR